MSKTAFSNISLYSQYVDYGAWQIVDKIAHHSPALGRLMAIPKIPQTIIQSILLAPMVAAECFLGIFVKKNKLAYAERFVAYLGISALSPLIALIKAIIEVVRILISPMKAAKMGKIETIQQTVLEEYNVYQPEYLIFEILIEDYEAKILEMSGEEELKSASDFDLKEKRKIIEDEEKIKEIKKLFDAYELNLKNGSDERMLDTNKEILLKRIVFNKDYATPDYEVSLRSILIEE